MLAYLSLKGVLGMFRRRRIKMRGCSVGGCQANDEFFMLRLKQMLNSAGQGTVPCARSRLVWAQAWGPGREHAYAGILDPHETHAWCAEGRIVLCHRV